MSSIISLPESIVIAYHSVLYLAERIDGLVKADEIAECHGFSVNHLAKVLQVLSKHGVVEAMKGPSGGYRLARSADQLSLLDVYELFEGPMSEQQCFLKKKVCSGTCMFQSVLLDAQRKIQDHFKATTFQDILKEKKDVLLPM